MSQHTNAQKGQGGRLPPLWPWLIPLALMAGAFELMPALRMFAASVQGPDAGLTLHNFVAIFTSRFYSNALLTSLYISLASSVAGLAVGATVAFAVARASEGVRLRFLTFANMTSNFSGVPLAFAYIILLGGNGVFTNVLKYALHVDLYKHFDLFSWTGLALVYIYFQIPLAVLLLYPAYAGLKPQWQEAAATLGATGWQFWRYVGLPVMLPAYGGAFGILFANALGAYATADAMTGGGINILPLRIAGLIAGDVNLDPNLASSMGVLLALLMVMALVLNQVLQRLYQRRTA